MSQRQGHALVIGGSMAGLLAAWVLADHFEHVTIVDRDAFPAGPEYRKGVPQSPHAHVLLARGQRVLEELFPGLVGELRDQGAVPVIAPQDMLALTPKGWAMRSSPRPLSLLSCSRELLEYNVRRRVTRNTAIALIEESDVEGLIPATDGRSIVGIRLRPRGGERATEAAKELHGQLVVDTSGRDSRMPEWLRAIGYEAPTETRVISRVGYASRYYARPDGFVADWKVLFFLPSVGSPRGGVLFPIEGDRWLVTIVGVGGDYPPTDEAAFLEFTRSLPTPILHDVLERSKPLSSPRGFRRTDNVRRGYEQLRRRPDGLIVAGDAACTFNPVYGQGMSVCAIEASELSRALAQEARADGFAHRVQRRLARVAGVPWLLATAADLAYPTTEGRRPGGLSRVIGRYTERLQAVATQDQVVASAFRYVTHLLNPPSSLFAPNVVARVLAPRRIRRRDTPTMKMSFGPSVVAPGDTAADRAEDLGVHRYAEVDGLRLHYVEQGSGPLVVLLHGFPEFWYSWRHQIRALADEGFRAVAVDMRGYNLSDKPTGVDAYRLTRLCADIADFIRALGSDRAHIVGHDWGGGVAWRLAMSYPTVVDRLVIMNAPHPAAFLRGIRTARQMRRSWYMFFFQLPWLPEAMLRAGNYRSLRRMFRKGTASDDADVERYVEAIAHPGALTAALNYYRALFRGLRGASDELRRIDAPTLIIWGDRDTFLGRELAAPDREWVPRMTLERLSDANHWVQLDRPDVVNRLLVDFLRLEKSTSQL